MKASSPLMCVLATPIPAEKVGETREANELSGTKKSSNLLEQTICIHSLVSRGSFYTRGLLMQVILVMYDKRRLGKFNILYEL